MIKTLDNKWYINNYINKGAFSSVYSVTPITSSSSSTSSSTTSSSTTSSSTTSTTSTTTKYVAKISKIPQQQYNKKKSRKETHEETSARLLYWEYQVYTNYANGHPSIPKRPFGRDGFGDTKDGYRYLILQRLDCTLKDITSTTTSSLAIIIIITQILDCLEYLHSKRILFRDIKPENFMLGCDDDHGRVYLVDFGAAKKFVLHTGKSQDTGGGVAGTPIFMSRHTMANKPPRPRDDLESLGYLLVWMLKKGSLPWSTNVDGLDMIEEMKLDINVDVLCKGIKPKKVLDVTKRYIDYVMGLELDEVVDYDMLLNDFMGVIGDGDLCELLLRENGGGGSEQEEDNNDDVVVMEVAKKQKVTLKKKVVKRKTTTTKPKSKTTTKPVKQKVDAPRSTQNTPPKQTKIQTPQKRKRSSSHPPRNSSSSPPSTTTVVTPQSQPRRSTRIAKIILTATIGAIGGAMYQQYS